MELEKTTSAQRAMIKKEQHNEVILMGMGMQINNNSGRSSTKAVISLARIRIHKYTKDGFSSLRRKKRFAGMKNRLLCICFVRKVISLEDEFTDTHYKMTRSLFVNS